jgi:hypothetical protein
MNVRWLLPIAKHKKLEMLKNLYFCSCLRRSTPLIWKTWSVGYRQCLVLWHETLMYVWVLQDEPSSKNPFSGADLASFLTFHVIFWPFQDDQTTLHYGWVQLLVVVVVVVVVRSLRSTQSSTAVRPSLATFQSPGCCLWHRTTGEGLHLTTPDSQDTGLRNSCWLTGSVMRDRAGIFHS